MRKEGSLTLRPGEQVRGMRLLPVFSPGRALLWGTILAAWGTGAVVASSSRALDIRTVCGGPGALLVGSLASRA